MRKYKARIVGFKWSQKSPAKYYPIFEYVDKYGKTRKYIRRRGVEKTPFTMKKNYIICKSKKHVYEKSEKCVNVRVYTMILKMLALLLMFFNTNLAFSVAICITLFSLIYELLELRNKMKNKNLMYTTKPIVGKIVEYQKTRPRNIFSHDEYTYRPLIQYVYGGCIYTHLSRVESREMEYRLHSNCYVFVDAKTKTVHDEMELNRPIVDVDLILNTIKKTSTKVEQAPTKVYVAQEKTDAVEAVNLEDTVRINIIPKSKQKVSGWY